MTARIRVGLAVVVAISGALLVRAVLLGSDSPPEPVATRVEPVGVPSQPTMPVATAAPASVPSPALASPSAVPRPSVETVGSGSVTAQKVAPVRGVGEDPSRLSPPVIDVSPIVPRK